jgi:hypothetical protein
VSLHSRNVSLVRWGVNGQYLLQTLHYCQSPSHSQLMTPPEVVSSILTYVIQHWFLVFLMPPAAGQLGLHLLQLLQFQLQSSSTDSSSSTSCSTSSCCGLQKISICCFLLPIRTARMAACSNALSLFHPFLLERYLVLSLPS